MGSNSSKSVPCQAQVQVQRKCETCKIDKDVYYKCDQCQVYACKSCSIIHQQASPSHKIREIGSNQPKLDKQTTASVNEAQFSDKRKCGLCLTSMMTRHICLECQTAMCINCYLIHFQIIHCFNMHMRNSILLTQQCGCQMKEKLMLTFCYSCLMKPVCTHCISEHYNHQLLTLKHQYKILKGRLSKDLAFTSIVLTEISIQKFENDLIFKYILEEVEKRESSKKTNYTKLRGNIEAEQIEIQTNLNDVESSIDNFKQILKAMQSRLQTANAEDNTLEALLESLNKLPQFHFGKLLQQIENLVPKNTIATARSFGIQVEERKKQSKIYIELMTSYETNFTAIERIITFNPKKALIIDYPSMSLCELLINDNKITSKDLSVNVMAMSVTPSEEILFNLFNHDALQLLTEEGFKPFMSLRPHQVFICSVHVTENSEIILGVYDNTIQRCSEDGDERKTKLMIFGTDKKLKKSLEYDGYGQRLFTCPHRIKSNINNEILVIDRQSKYNGRVISLKREGQVKWIYQGHPEVNSDYKLFDPSDIVTITLRGQMIVTDCLNHTLHVLSEEGALLSCESVKAKGILLPLTLYIDNIGQLWIGCYADSVTEKAKLHITHFTIPY